MAPLTPVPHPHSHDSQASPSFVPRPFPPPSLTGVPYEYIVDSLRKLAPHFWNKSATADCSIMYPYFDVSTGLRLRDQNVPRPVHTPEVHLAHNTRDSFGRRFTAPDPDTSRIVMTLHIDYLSAQSTLLRALFSGVSPLDLINTSPRLARTSTTDLSQLPQLHSQNPRHPIVYLPIPDPSSFHYLVTWMYFGLTDDIERALHHRVIRWDRLVANVEYLGMPREIKQFLGSYYGRWLQPAPARPLPAAQLSIGEASDVEEDGDMVVATDMEDEDEVNCMINGHAESWDSDDDMPVDIPRGRSRERLPFQFNGLFKVSQ
ncbi:hypothetical protein FA95DRAFT_1600410 [Auriscalpium vulgare]|uniref:Uncharacterized protein n=1 Tax=Auriscalpium vulgare TaxID=40419 RepID=A0ACB8SDB8_9AGAM|nr:hypothetical protein FA95DRAFT_1600410 [Auriscalpium vulgare]